MEEEKIDETSTIREDDITSSRGEIKKNKSSEEANQEASLRRST
jgi:hypothetical protein